MVEVYHNIINALWVGSIVFMAIILLVGVHGLSPSTISSSSSSAHSRRKWLSQVLQQGGTIVAVAAAAPSASIASDELPSFLKDYTKLAPLGTKQQTTKTTGLSLAQLASRLSQDLVEGATGQGGYFLSGDLSGDLFRDDCIFADPTNRVDSLSQYQAALRILFDPQTSTVELIEPLQVLVDDEEGEAGQRTIRGRIRSRGYLQLPWKPYVTAYESTIVYTVDRDGLISRQDQTWSKDALVALQESFTPSWVDPPPKSSQRSTTSTEPALVTKLFERINGRRPYEYSREERREMDAWIDEIVQNAQGPDKFDRSLFPGTWILAYLQPGPGGAGIDRRIPFPDFNFNDNFQIFGQDQTVVNLGQLLGPVANVQVYGTIQEPDPSSASVPKRLQANIQGGKLCLFQKQACIDLPIHGEGLFDSLYVGERIRIGQNINGGGARIVQIRLEDTALPD